MESSAQKTLWTVIAVVVIVIVGYVFLSGSPEGTATPPKAKVIVTPVVSQEQLLGKAPLATEQKDAISVHKAEILARVASGKPLTQEEKGSIGNIMLTQAHLYKFTDEEREAVFSALRK